MSVVDVALLYSIKIKIEIKVPDTVLGDIMGPGYPLSLVFPETKGNQDPLYRSKQCQVIVLRHFNHNF